MAKCLNLKPCKGLLTLVYATALTLGAGAATADEVTFEGQTIEFIVPFSAGGGTDTLARFNVPFLSRYLPGNPNVVIVNQPGGSSTNGANLFATRARPDGLTILGTAASTQMAYLLGDPRVQFDYADWEVVAATPNGTVVFGSPELGVDGLDTMVNLTNVPITTARNSPTGGSLPMLYMFDFLGLDDNPVFGFRGGGEILLAFERGETDVSSATTPTYLTTVLPMVEAGQAVPFFTVGLVTAEGELERDPALPNLPHFGEVFEAIYGEPPSGDRYETLLSLLAASSAARNIYFLPEGTPDDIVGAYQLAIQQMLEDPEYLAAKGAVIGDYDQITGQEAEVLVERVVSLPAEERQGIRDFITENYGVTF